MGKCLSCSREQESDPEKSEPGSVRRPTGPAGFGDDTERNKSRTEAKRGRRRSSGLSRFSVGERHVIEKPLKIAAFNVRRFGKAKMKDATTVDLLVKIIRSFDLILIQEVVDVNGTAVSDLLKAVNEADRLANGGTGDPSSAQSTGDDERDGHGYITDINKSGAYSIAESPRLGRSAQKEQYVVFYRNRRVELLDSQVYSDPDDVFVREPFILTFQSEVVQSEVATFSLVGIHTRPESAVKEIDALMDVWSYVRDHMSAENTIILGDFNAGGQYVKAQDWDNIRLRTDAACHWLIPDHVDTTATNTLAAYDRIVVCGEALKRNVEPNSADVFRYDELWNVPESVLLKVSDHFPVSLSLKPSHHPLLEKNITNKVIVKVEDKRFPQLDSSSLLSTLVFPRFKLRTLYNSSGELEMAELRSQRLSSPDAVVTALLKLRASLGFISYSQVAAVRHKLSEGVIVDSSLNGREDKVSYNLIVSLDLGNKVFACLVEISSFI